MDENKKFRIGLIGAGTIGKALSEMIKKDMEMELVFVYDNIQEKSTVRSVNEGLNLGVDLAVEAASKEAVMENAEKVLSKTDFLVLSSSAFADKKFEQKVISACKKNKTRVIVPPGAIIGLDGISAVKKEITKAVITTTKNPKSFGRKDKNKTVLFDGTARKAALAYPANVNVAATLALNSIGFDRTKAKIVSDPKARSNMHEIEIEGKFGRFFVRVENAPSKNPKTSALAAKTTFEQIKNIRKQASVYP